MPFAPELQVQKQRRRIKPKDQHKLKNKILELTLQGLGNADIARHPDVNFTISADGHCQQVYRIQNMLVIEGKLKRDALTKQLIGTEIASEKHKWQKATENIAKQNSKTLSIFWDSLSNKNDGKGDPNAQQYFNDICTVCNTVQVHPDEIIYAVDDQGQPAYLQKAKQVAEEFVKKLNANEIIRQGNYSPTLSHDGQTNKRAFIMAIRQFLLGNGKFLPKLPKEHVLSGNKGATFGSYNKIDLSDRQFDSMLDFAVKEAKDFGYVAMIALMREMITRTESITTWTVPSSSTTEYDEFEGMPVEYDFVKAFHETKTEKSKPDWDKFIIAPRTREIFAEIQKDRKGRTLVELATHRKVAMSADVETELNRICREFYINSGILDETARLPNMVNHQRNPEKTFYKLGTEQYFFNSHPAYVLRHSGAHTWCRRTKYDYGFVSELGWGDMNTLKQCYAGMNLKQMLKASMCMYCKAPQNPDKLNSHMFCSATHAFIYYSNGCKPKSGGNQN